jgi:FKBP-type peptidyl-prolyl cis-trans isomerase
MRVPALLLVCCFALLSAGCGSGSQAESESEVRRNTAHEARIAAERQRERQRIREAHRAAARARHEAARRKAHREAARQRAQAEARQAEAEEREQRESEKSEETSECDPNYSGACLDPYASDYDCAGGSGDGPEYTGPVTVVGEDHYGLDSDNDGSACEY